MNAPLPPPIEMLQQVDAEAALVALAAPLRAGTIVPYLGPALASLSKPAAPMTPEALAEFSAPRLPCHAVPGAMPGRPPSILRA